MATPFIQGFHYYASFEINISEERINPGILVGLIQISSFPLRVRSGSELVNEYGSGTQNPDPISF